MFTIHATKKLLDRVKPQAALGAPEPTTVLGDWYATAMFWKPQVALLVNERTLFPVLMPLAPASTLLKRFPGSLRKVLEARGVAAEFIDLEIAAMAEGGYAKTANRSVVGSMVDFEYLANVYKDQRGADDLVTIALKLSQVPCSPLRKGHGFPDSELDALIAAWAERSGSSGAEYGRL